MDNLNSYNLSRSWFEWSFNNPEIVKPIHSAIYFFAIEHCNRLGWKEKFGFPSQMVMEAIGVKNWRTYSKALNDLVDFGFIEMIEVSKNQYSSNIIAIVKNTKAHTKALDKALSKHSTKHSTKQGQGTVSIDKQLNKEQETINKEQRTILMSHAKRDDVTEINQEYYDIAKAFYDLLIVNSEKLGVQWNHLKKVKADEFIKHIRLMVVQDNRSQDDLRQVWSFLSKDDFWMQNIQSSKKLREKFDQLITKAKNGNSKTQGSRLIEQLSKTEYWKHL